MSEALEIAVIDGVFLALQLGVTLLVQLSRARDRAIEPRALPKGRGDLLVGEAKILVFELPELFLELVAIRLEFERIVRLKLARYADETRNLRAAYLGARVGERAVGGAAQTRRK